MPKEGKKRGRRGLEQQKRELEEVPASSNKRRKIDNDDAIFEQEEDRGDGFIAFEDEPMPDQADQQTTFYGLLTEEEQAYYANVNSKITNNDFESDEDRASFIAAVYRESGGKEIKLASSQSCSRHLERLMKLSTPTQLRDLFRAFLQDLEYLIQHRFGSHCVETLFAESAQYVVADMKLKKQASAEDEFEGLFLQAVEKIKPNVGFMVTETFASHTLRVLLAVLLGEPIADKNSQSTLASRKKEGIELDETATSDSAPRRVPVSFRRAQRDLNKAVVAGLDSNYLRALATSPTGNPVLQMLLTADIKGYNDEGDEKYVVLKKLVADLDFEPESESSRWVASLIYDTTGAYLVQTLVKSLPGKLFKKMYKNLFSDRIGKLAKNDIACYVAISIFNRLGGDDLRAVGPAILEEIPGMVERQRLAPLRAYVEALSRRGVQYAPLRDTLIQCFAIEKQNSSAILLYRMLGLELPKGYISGELSNEARDALKIQTQGALLAQSLLTYKETCSLIQEALLATNPEIFQVLAKDPAASRVIQTALTTETSTKAFLRSLMPKFDHDLVALSLHKCGSHVVDALWVATNGLHYLKEKFAAILAGSQHEIRDSLYGRIVWRNWHMDLYIRKRRDWVNIATHGSSMPHHPEHDTTKDDLPAKNKTPLQLARERAAKKNAQKQKTTSFATQPKPITS